MAFLMAKKINGHEYFYLVKSRRVGTKITHDILAYFGKEKPKKMPNKKALAKMATEARRKKQNTSPKEGVKKTKTLVASSIEGERVAGHTEE